MKLSRIPSGRLIACDTETTGLSPWLGDRIFALSFCNEEGATGYFRWSVDPFTRAVSVPPKDLLEIKCFFENSSISKVFHNAKFDIRMLSMLGVSVKGVVQDTMFAMHVLRTAEPELGLKPLSKKYLGIPDDDEKALQAATNKARREGKKLGWKVASKETHGKDPTKADYWLAPPEICKTYAVRDVERTMPLWLLLEEKLEEEGLRKIYDEEMRLFWVTYKMESRGVRVDPVAIDGEIKRNQAIIVKANLEIQKIKPGINVNSPKQLVTYLHGERKHPVLKYSCKCIPGMTCRRDNHMKNPSVGTEVLLRMNDPLSRTIVEFKTAEKALNGFFGRFKKLMRKEADGYILHPDFHQIGPVTGRYSCREPNLQNVADPYGTRAPIPIPARKVFVPRPGYEWWHYDYKQMELWLFSSPAIANETKMLNVLLSGEDLPRSVGIEMGWKDKLDWDKANGKGTTRIRVKLMLYGIVYGIGPSGLALLNNISYNEAMHDLDTFKKRYPGIDLYMQRTVRAARRDGYVEEPLGRRFQTDNDTAYKAANYTVQGCAAHILKKAMIDTNEWLEKNKIDGHLIMTIHDELAFEIHKKHATLKTMLGLKRIMESYGKHFGIPKLPTDVERVRTNWMEKEEIDL